MVSRGMLLDELGGLWLLKPQCPTLADRAPHDRCRYMLTAESVTSREMMLNGHVLRLQQDDSLPDLKPVVTTDGGPLVLPPASISYVQFPLAERCN